MNERSKLKRRAGGALSILLAILVVLTFMPSMPETARAAGGTIAGSGTETDPYLIEDAADLAKLATNVDNGITYEGKYIKMTGDIDLSAYPDFNPIGGGTNRDLKYFRGTFDGDGHRITNLKIVYKPTTGGGWNPVVHHSTYSGLFGAIRGATLKNFTVSGTVGAGYRSGGVVGSTRDACTLQGIGAEVDVTAHTPEAGYDSTQAIGGLIGEVDSGTTITIDQCYNRGTISNDESGDYARTGGLVGSIQAGGSHVSITNSYNTGDVSDTAGGSIGGLVGGMIMSGDEQVSLTNCYNAAKITGSNFVGQLVGGVSRAAQVTMKNCYYDKDLNKYMSAMGQVFPGVTGFTPKSTAEMKVQQAVDDLNPERINFAMDTENVNKGYPILDPVATSKITFDANGGQGTMDDIIVNEGDSAALMTNSFQREGYTFTGWNTEANGSGTAYADGAEVTPDADMTLYAQWSIITFKVSFDANDGEGTMDPQSLDYGRETALTTNTFTRKGYTFTGWNTAADGSGTAYTDGAQVTTKQDMTLYAQWSANTYNVSFNANGGKGSMDTQSLEYGRDAELAKNTFKRDGYSFTGWNTAADGSGTAYTDGATVSDLTAVDGETITMYAQWKVVPAKPYVLARVTAKGKKAQKLTWTKVKGASGYDIYFARCSGKDKNYQLKKLKTVKGLTFTKKHLRKYTYYKWRVRAFKTVNGKKTYIASSLVAHATTGDLSRGGKCTNAKAVKLNKKSIALKAGRSTKVKATAVKARKGRKFAANHVKNIRFFSTDSRIAKVSSTGRITAKRAGKCKVYAVAQNGVWKGITITVK
ncbi:MAG: InlB B-repeat-containing protein [Anaerovoracaceae bacterium]|jgi:uncharacterized repeat protein (TIGR02543 family)